MENEIFKINYDTERPTTSVRDLWEFLGKPYTKFTMWFDKYKDYGFTENEDYRELSVKVYTSNGASHDAVDYEITVDMAKELSMLQKSDKGKMARKYFIDLEKQWNSPEAIMARAIKMADSKIIKLEEQIEIDKPKVLFAEAVEDSEDVILVKEMATILSQRGFEVGQNQLYQFLRDREYLCKKEGDMYHLPTKKYQHLFKVTKRVVQNSKGSMIRNTPKITGKGQLHFIKKFDNYIEQGLTIKDLLCEEAQLVNG